MKLVHNVATPEIPARRTVSEFDTEEGWENAIYEALMEGTCYQDLMDMVHRYRAWLKIETYREVSRMLRDNNDGRFAREKIAFMIRREQR